jgi:hypothetical protein|tara:strand:- start:2941 stop:3276 length:336 start_codon:yes stop_codon:yes gene_type:complete
LKALGHKVEEQKQIMVVSDAEHAKGHPDIEIDIKAGSDIGFRWNEELEVYELVTDLQTWSLPIDQRFFIQKLQQEYALLSIVSSVKEDGFQIEEQYVAEDGAVELVCTRWT